MDPLGTDFSGQVEISRWRFLDSQIFGLMNIFGNGVVEGWNVTSEDSFTIQIDEGFGNINFISARTSFPESLELAPSSTSYIYVRSIPSILTNEDVEFISTPLPQSSLGLLLLSKVTTGTLGITDIDNSVRQDISFLQTIKDSIKNHKHKGGDNYPSKIDLVSEVKGKLDAFHIADFDAQKITTGTFELGRVPLLQHEDLQNTGILTHPQLDSFVKTLQADNKELFGEIVTSNVLQMIIALKLLYDDPDIGTFSVSPVDQNMINEFAVIPGITPNSFIDFDATTAEIDLVNHFIKGLPPATGTQFYVTYNTDLAWNSSHSSENVVILNDTVSLEFNDAQSNILHLNNFENVTAANQEISGFKKETVLLVDEAKIVSHSSSTNVIEGFYSGKVTNKQIFRSQFVREFDSAQDWSTYDSFVLNIKTLDQTHGQVKLFFQDSNGNETTHYVLIDTNETTSNVDPEMNGFKLVIIDLTMISIRNDIKSFTIYTDDTKSDFIFYIDDINIQRSVFLPDEGSIVMRYSSNTAVTFQSIEWTSVEPSGSSIDVRTRSSNNVSLLNRQSYTDFLTSGDIIGLTGTDLEIEITLKPDGDKLVSPTLNELKILIIADSEVDGFSINTDDEFSRGNSENLNIKNTPDRLELTTPIYVNSYYFCLSNQANQIHKDLDGNINGELSLSGKNFPISPNQIFRSLEDNSNQGSSSSFMFGPRSITRQVDRSYVISDTYNDRVLQVDENDALISGVGSINYTHTDLFPISACVDIRTQILYIIFSKSILLSSININKIRIKTIQGQTVQLIQDSDQIDGILQSDLGTSESQIVAIHLSAQNGSLVPFLPSDGSFLQIDNDAVTVGIKTDNKFYRAAKTANGIPVFIGNFAYIEGIFSPTTSNKTDSGGWIIGNAKLGVKDFVFSDESLTKNENITSVIMLDKNNRSFFGWDGMDFSPFVPGRIHQIGNDLLIGGIQKEGEIDTTALDNLTFRSFSSDKDEQLQQKSTLKTLLAAKTGGAVLLDITTSTVSFSYSSSEGLMLSDIDIDSSGNFVAAESSFDKSGRVIKLDSLGNINFSYGEGKFSVINGINVKQDNSIIIST